MNRPIREDEWRSELEKVLFRAGDDGLTVQELCAKMRLAEGAVRKRLQAIKLSGRLVIGKAHREALDGTMRLSAVYRIAPKPTRKPQER